MNRRDEALGHRVGVAADAADELERRPRPETPSASSSAPARASRGLSCS